MGKKKLSELLFPYVLKANTWLWENEANVQLTFKEVSNPIL